MKIIISSCETYSKLTLPVLINSLLGCGVNKSDIIISMNSNLENITKFDEIKCYKYDTNIFEYVAFKTCLLIEEDMFFIHDTCVVSDNFKQNLDSFDLQKFDTVKLTNTYTSCGMGFYKFNFLKKKKDFIFNLKSISKQEAICLENSFFGGNIGFFCNDISFVSEPKISPYKSNVLRIEEHYNPPGIIKYKSNWGANNGSSGYFIDL